MRRPLRFMPPLGAPPLSAKDRVLADWRRVDVSPSEKMRANPAKTMENVLPGVLKTLRLDQRRAEAEIVRVWNNILDPNIAEHAKPDRLRKGTLFVVVDSNVWLDEIVRYRRKEILDRLHHCFGRELILKISFRVG
jgi:predicted nucleic acid-binding Zn ribbon protein